MELEFTVKTRIKRPVAVVFHGIYNPKKLSSHFATGGASGALDAGKTGTGDLEDLPGAHPVHIKEMNRNEKIIIERPNSEEGVTKVEIAFDPREDCSTMVSITESGWCRTIKRCLDELYERRVNWTQMLRGFKGYLEDAKCGEIYGRGNSRVS